MLLNVLHKVRTATSLGTGSVSVASTAVAKAKELIGDTAGVKSFGYWCWSYE